MPACLPLKRASQQEQPHESRLTGRPPLDSIADTRMPRQTTITGGNRDPICTAAPSAAPRRTDSTVHADAPGLSLWLGGLAKGNFTAGEEPMAQSMAAVPRRQRLYYLHPCILAFTALTRKVLNAQGPCYFDTSPVKDQVSQESC